METTVKELEGQIVELRERIAELATTLESGAALNKRIERIERALIRKKLIRLPGQDITDATWMPDPSSKGWQVHFEYFCEPCDESHATSLDIPPHVKDGNEYEVTGRCEHVCKMKIWKKGADVFHPNGGPNGMPNVFSGF